MRCQVTYLSVLTCMEDKLKKTLQEQCDKMDLYPSKVVKNAKGFTITFFKPDACPSYKFMDNIFAVVNSLKMALNTSTVMIQNGFVNVTGSISVIKNIMEAVSEKVSEKDSLIKRLSEDIEMFNSHAKAQILDSDYDTREGRSADIHAIRHERAAKKGVGSKLTEGSNQYEIDWAALMSE